MNGTEDSDSDTEFDVNKSLYNVAIQLVDQAPDLSYDDIIPWSKWWKKKMDTLKLILIATTTSGTKHINYCNEPMDFFIFCTHMKDGKM